jgi:hypothetical protein
MDAWGAFVPTFLAFLFLDSQFSHPQCAPQAPEICTLYCLDVPPSAVRAVIRQRFEKNRYVSDPKVIDVLIHKSRQDYQEAVNFWKQEPHVLGHLLSDRDRPHRTFMQKFLEGGSSQCSFFVAVPALLTHLNPVSLTQGGMRMPFFLHHPMCNIVCTCIDFFFRRQNMIWSL